ALATPGPALSWVAAHSPLEQRKPLPSVGSELLDDQFAPPPPMQVRRRIITQISGSGHYVLGCRTHLGSPGLCVYELRQESVQLSIIRVTRHHPSCIPLFLSSIFLDVVHDTGSAVPTTSSSTSWTHLPLIFFKSDLKRIWEKLRA